MSKKILEASDAAVAETEALVKRHPERTYCSGMGDSLRKIREDVERRWPPGEETADLPMNLTA
jgi:hypothetical protein